MRKTLANPVTCRSRIASTLALALALGIASCDWEAQIKTLDDQQRVLSNNYEVLLSQLNELRLNRQNLFVLYVSRFSGV